MELLLQVISYLPYKADSQSLRITCRTFRHIITFPDEWEHGTAGGPRYEHNSSEAARYEFLQRLVSPGDIFDDEDCRLCAMCLSVQHTKNFPFGYEELMIDGEDVCGNCIKLLICKTLPKGHYAAFDGAEYYLCHRCNEPVREDDSRGCGREDEDYDIYCSSCHLETCGDTQCLGYQMDDMNIHLSHDEEDGYDRDQDYHPKCTCMECEKKCP